MDVRKICSGFFFLALLFSCNDEPNQVKVYNSSLEENNGAISIGEQIYTQNCISCHGSNGKLGSSGAKDLSKSISSDKRIEKIVIFGKGAMPPFGYVVDSPEKLNSLIEYIKKFRKR